MTENTIPEGTPEHHVDAVRQATEKLTSDLESLGANSIHLDDWGRFSNFSIIVNPALVAGRENKLQNPRLAFVVKRAIRMELLALGHRVKTRVSRPWSDGHYCINIDVDFNQYDRQSNRFHALAG